jgi:hypothetical protein
MHSLFRRAGILHTALHRRSTGQGRVTNKSLCLEGYGLFLHRHNGKTTHKLPINCQCQLSRGYLLLARLASGKYSKICLDIEPSSARSFLFLLAAKVKWGLKNGHTNLCLINTFCTATPLHWLRVTAACLLSIVLIWTCSLRIVYYHGFHNSLP